jgi:hypothetical protein
MDYKLYEKILYIFLVLRDTREQFMTYSAQDIKKLIESKMKSKTAKEPKALQQLYRLETMIAELRETMDIAKSEGNIPSADHRIQEGE